MRRFYVFSEDVKKDKIYIKGSEAHHILNVMRLSIGDKIVVFDGTGNEYVGVIENKSQKELTVRIEEVRKSKNIVNFKITLAQAIPKGNKMDYIIQKCTELGVDTIIPLMTNRTVVNLNGKRGLSRMERWKKITIEASKQCGRVIIPQVKEPKKLERVLTTLDSFDLSIIPCLSKNIIGLKELISGNDFDKLIVFIGPEGGFTTEEIQMAEKFGCIPVSLGPMVLKSDTAAIYVTAILNYELGLK